MKRQFIAGATCPECGQLDKIQRVQEGDRMWMECVACGMKKNLGDEPAPSAEDDGARPITFKP